MNIMINCPHCDSILEIEEQETFIRCHCGCGISENILKDIKKSKQNIIDSTINKEFEEKFKKHLTTNRKLNIHYIATTDNCHGFSKSNITLYLKKNKKLLKKLSKK